MNTINLQLPKATAAVTASTRPAKASIIKDPPPYPFSWVTDTLKVTGGVANMDAQSIFNERMLITSRTEAYDTQLVYEMKFGNWARERTNGPFHKAYAPSRVLSLTPGNRQNLYHVLVEADSYMGAWQRLFAWSCERIGMVPCPPIIVRTTVLVSPSADPGLMGKAVNDANAAAKHTIDTANAKIKDKTKWKVYYPIGAEWSANTNGTIEVALMGSDYKLMNQALLQFVASATGQKFVATVAGYNTLMKACVGKTYISYYFVSDHNHGGTEGYPFNKPAIIMQGASTAKRFAETLPWYDYTIHYNHSGLYASYVTRLNPWCNTVQVLSSDVGANAVSEAVKIIAEVVVVAVSVVTMQPELIALALLNFGLNEAGVSVPWLGMITGALTGNILTILESALNTAGVHIPGLYFKVAGRAVNEIETLLS